VSLKIFPLLLIDVLKKTFQVRFMTLISVNLTANQAVSIPKMPYYKNKKKLRADIALSFF